MRLASLVGAILFASLSATASAGPADDMVTIPGGRFVMGDPAGDENEAPRTVSVSPFRIMRHEVTVDQYAAYVAASDRTTDPERKGDVRKAGEWVRDIFTGCGIKAELLDGNTVLGCPHRHGLHQMPVGAADVEEVAVTRHRRRDHSPRSLPAVGVASEPRLAPDVGVGEVGRF